jgi:hypothetical protein
MHTTTFMEMRWLSDDARHAVADQRDEYEAWFGEAVARAQASGDLRDDIGTKELTLALLGLVNWLVFWYRPDGPLSAHDIAELMLTVFLDGARLEPIAGAEGR